MLLSRYVLKCKQIFAKNINNYEKIKCFSCNIKNRKFSSQFDSISGLNGTDVKIDSNLINQDILLKDKNDLSQKLLGTIKHIPQEIDKYSKDHFLDNNGTYSVDQDIAYSHSGLYLKELALGNFYFIHSLLLYDLFI